MNVLDLTFTFGNNDLQIMLLDPMTMLPLAGFPMVYPAIPGGQQSVQLFFTGCPSGNVIIQITSPGGMAPYPDVFVLNYAAVSTQQTTYTHVCWDEDYRFGFNGMEKDNEAKGQGNNLNFGARILDSRLGRWLSLDPLMHKFAYVSPYTFCLNSPIYLMDPDGREPGIPQVTSEVSFSFSYKLMERDVVTDDEQYGEVAFTVTVVKYDDGSTKFVVSTSASNAKGVGSAISLSVDETTGNISGSFSFSDGTETVTETSTSSSGASVEVKIPGTPVGAGVNQQKTNTASTGKVLNGAKEEFQIQLVYDAENNKYNQTVLPTKEQLDAGADRLSKNETTMPEDGVGNEGWFSDDNELEIEATVPDP